MQTQFRIQGHEVFTWNEMTINVIDNPAVFSKLLTIVLGPNIVLNDKI